MGKLMNKSFWIILLISLITLIGLTVGVVLLTKESQKEFYAAGYIIDTTASKGDKYYFDDNTIYKENVFDEYVFKNKDNKEVSSSKDNFIHYADNSLSFMKNGVILDLDNFNKNLVPYYNITDKSIIKYNNGNYYIETSDKTLTFGNFLGRITDNKYIVVGNDIRIKVAGSEETVKGKYFEFIFVEDGVVKIVNEDVNYQTITEGTIIYVGDKIKINLGDKLVISEDEVKLSLNEMTIDGNENIDIVPSDGKVDKGEDSTDGGANGEGTVKSVIKKEITVDLLNATVDANNIDTDFQVIDTGNYIKGNLIFTLQNITEEEELRIKEYDFSTEKIKKVEFNDLTPNCNYLMTVTSKNDISETQYFRRVFKTQSLSDVNVKLEMADTNSLEYVVEFNNPNIKSGVITLTSDKGSVSKTIKNQGVYSSINFDGLDSDTKYNVTLSNITYSNPGSANIIDEKSISVGSNMTLKNKPKFNGLSYEVNSDKQMARLIVEAPEDLNGSIKKYTYKIYKNISSGDDGFTNKELVYEFSKTREQLETKIINVDGKDYEVIADNEEKLFVDDKKIFTETTYAYEVVMEYYDNYKSGIVESPSIGGIIIPEKKSEKEPIKLTFTPDKDEKDPEKTRITSDEIHGIINIKDENCDVLASERECNNGDNNFIIKYRSSNDTNDTIISDADFKETVKGSNNLQYHLDLTGLKQNTVYSFEVFGDHYVDGTLNKGGYIGTFVVVTAAMDTLKMQNWNQNDYSYDVPISVSTEIVSEKVESNLVDRLNSITYNLYRGKKVEGEPIKSYTVTGTDIVRNELFNITSKDFGIENLDELRILSGGKLNDNYTIEVTDAYDEAGVNQIVINNNVFVFNTPPLLILEDAVSDIKIVVDKITNVQTKSGEYDVSYNSSLDDDIVVGYKVTASIIDMPKITSRYNPKKLNFYVYDGKNRLIESKDQDIIYDDAGIAVNEYTTYFYLKNGTDYSKEDKDLRRGNEYTFAFDISVDTDNDSEIDTNFPSNKIKSSKQIALKQNPTFKMYIDKTTDTSVTYNYKIVDIDNAFYNEEDKAYMYYTVGDSAEEYKSEIVDDSFTINNLSNSSIYNISYYRANDKNVDASKVKLNSYYFDGSYTIDNLGYNLKYGDFDNRLKVVIDNNDLLGRVSAYIVTLTAGSEKYQEVITQNKLSDCDENKCVIIDYADIANLKGKDITTSVEAIYDTGYTGFSMNSKLESYFTNLGLVESGKYKVGYLYQSNGSTGPGKYIYVDLNDAKNKNIFRTSNVPNGILAYELVSGNPISKLNTSNLVDIDNKKLVSYGTIKNNNVDIQVLQDGYYDISDKFIINPKILDKVNLNTSDNSFKFTSITPKVTSTVSPTINGATINVDLSIDQDTLESDFVKTDGKYKFYVDIYQKKTCEAEVECSDELVKTVETDYDDIGSITFQELEPASSYYYKIYAEMNKNNKKVKTPLFDYNKSGYVEYQNAFSTLDASKIFDYVNYKYTSSSDTTDNIYSVRKLTTKAFLKNINNFDVKFELYDKDGELEYSYTVANEDITIGSNKKWVTYIEDITGNDFVFGPGYHTLKVTAVTTDSKHNELELYKDTLKDNATGYDFYELQNPTFTVTPNATIEQKSGENVYSINTNIVVEDIDKVIKNGKFYVELQKATSSNEEGFTNACPGHEDDCKFTVDYFKNGFNINHKFTDLKPNTSYYIYVYADTYRNNISLSESDKNSVVYIRENQYTKNELGFSLGLVTLTATSKNKVVITFPGSSNLTNSITGIEYGINIKHGPSIASGKLGKTSNTDTDVIPFKVNNNVPSLEITIPSGKQLGKENFVQLTYYYKDTNGDIVALVLDGETVIETGVDYNGN